MKVSFVPTRKGGNEAKMLKRFLKLVLTCTAFGIVFAAGGRVCAKNADSITWKAGNDIVKLSDKYSADVSVMDHRKQNTVTIRPSVENVKGVALMVIPAYDEYNGVLNPNDAVYAAQRTVTDSSATFDFYLPQELDNGVYAVCASYSYTNYAVGYFKVENATSPHIVPGQILQYDDYKKKIVLEFAESNGTSFEKWTEKKNEMLAKLSNAENEVEISDSDIEFDTDKMTISINTENYTEIFPADNTDYERNIQQTEISIQTPGYWGDTEFGGVRKGTFGMVIRSFSAEGFADGLSFDVKLESEVTLTGADVIAALYDGNTLVDCRLAENLSITADRAKSVHIHIKNEKLTPSGSFKIKIMLWDKERLSPITPIIQFP